jgi:hypothetical protein
MTVRTSTYALCRKEEYGSHFKKFTTIFFYDEIAPYKKGNLYFEPFGLIRFFFNHKHLWLGVEFFTSMF